jgi:hypothetical protein
MPISGLVLTLAPAGPVRDAALAALAADSRVTLGALVEPGAVLPVVTETTDAAAHEALWRRLAAIDGVLQVRLAFHDFSDVRDFDAGFAPRRARRDAPEGG